MIEAGAPWLGELVRRLRTARLLSQLELAERAGLSVRTLFNLERGKVDRPRLSTVRLIADALGLEPVERRELLSAAERIAADPPAPGEVPPPAQLPPDVRPFVGRDEELGLLDALIVGPDADVTRSRLVTVSGTAGVGKTALVVHWAHRAAVDFPDGQLYVNLRGFDPGPPRSAADALVALLRGLDASASELAGDEEHLAAAYRTRLAGRRVLVVLDNAVSAAQVRPLLPGAPWCAVVVTSRHKLGGLVAREGARRLGIDVLSPAGAVGLLEVLVGDRVGEEPAAAAELVRRCARLPLALRVAAEQVNLRDEATIAEVARDLGARRLDALSVQDDPQTAVRQVFSWSYERLEPSVAAGFRLLGAHPGRLLDVASLAALADVPTGDAAELLATLADRHLVELAAGGWTQHDLLRAYAVELSRQDPPAVAREAVRRLADHLASVAAATAAVALPNPGAAGGEPAAAVDPAAALRWLDTWRSTLVAVAVDAGRRGLDRECIDLATGLARYLDFGYHSTQTRAVQELAVRSARRLGDRAAEADARGRLGIMLWRIDEYDASIDQHQRERQLRRALGDRAGEGRALLRAASAKRTAGRYASALTDVQAAAELLADTDDLQGRALVHYSIGLLHSRLDDHGAARDAYQRASAGAELAGAPMMQVAITDAWGTAELRLGNDTTALRLHQQALLGAIEYHDRNHEAAALDNIGRVLLRLDRPRDAMTHFERSLALVEQLGIRSARAEVLDNIGRVRQRLGQLDRARADHESALALAREIDTRPVQAVILNSLGECLRAAGELADAVRHHENALEIATEVGSRSEEDRARAGIAAAHDAGRA